MKKAILLFLFFTLAASGAAAKDSKKLQVITTIFPQYDFVRQVAKDKVELTQLLPLGAESHSYEPSPKDIIKIQNCDVFIYVGGEGDAWVEKILASIDVKNKKIISLMDCVSTVKEELVEGMQEEEGEEEEDAYDEHVWTSPKNAKIITQTIADVLQKADSQNSDFYEANAKNYILQLDALDADFEETVKNSKRDAIIFADRFPFRYFADAYKLKYFAAFPGCSTETEASAGTVKFLIDKIKSEKIPVVFHIELSNEKMADAIAESTGAKKLLFHSCHNVSKKDFKAGLGYADLMKRNVSVLKEALN
ncbi:MAG: metal ABC transporter substrate-binding protein [Endomicrobium sp.]|jgi:zinc transport system substrate-binding protein|nr:metal ABC transporter substrate-binding protein [Endomicrobium sp.]